MQIKKNNSVRAELVVESTNLERGGFTTGNQTLESEARIILQLQISSSTLRAT